MAPPISRHRHIVRGGKPGQRQLAELDASGHRSYPPTNHPRVRRIPPDDKTPLTITIEAGSDSIQALDHLNWHNYMAGLAMRLQPDGTPIITGTPRLHGK